LISAEIRTTFDRIVQEVPSLIARGILAFYAGDSDGFRARYRLPPVVFQLLPEMRNELTDLVVRYDIALVERQPKLLEINVGSKCGGWQVVRAMYARIVAESSTGGEVKFDDTFGAMTFDASGRVRHRGEIVDCVLISASDLQVPAELSLAHFRRLVFCPDNRLRALIADKANFAILHAVKAAGGLDARDAGLVDDYIPFAAFLSDIAPGARARRQSRSRAEARHVQSGQARVRRTLPDRRRVVRRAGERRYPRGLDRPGLLPPGSAVRPGRHRHRPGGARGDLGRLRLRPDLRRRLRPPDALRPEPWRHQQRPRRERVRYL